MNTTTIRKCIDVIDNCRTRQNELYRISGKYDLSKTIQEEIDKECMEYQKTINEHESKIKQLI